jgi:sulfur-carrier protein adenylyltransferase/sulfurtransferase
MEEAMTQSDRPPARTDEDLPALDADERHRYSRHLLLPELGEEGQRRLKAGRVLVVGAGGLGSPAALYLAAAGVGTLGLVDFDVVDRSNLQRQVLYGESGIGRPKLEEAKRRLLDLNPHTHVVLHPDPLTSDNARAIIRDYDVVLDGTDNFPTRYLVNDACVLEGKPNVYGSIFRFEGQVSVFHHDGGPCYRCLYPDPPPPGLVPSCAEGGVLGVLPGVVGTLQATEALKVLAGIGTTLSGRLILYDALGLEFHEVRLRGDPACKVCGPDATVTELIDYQAFCNPAGADGGGDAVPTITVQELVALRAAEPDTPLVDVREPGEHAIACIEGDQLIPLARITDHLDGLPRGRTVVVYCKKGPRSAQATRVMRQAGIDAVNLQGGIDAWTDQVDPSLTRY